MLPISTCTRLKLDEFATSIEIIKSLKKKLVVDNLIMLAMSLMNVIN